MDIRKFLPARDSFNPSPNQMTPIASPQNKGTSSSQQLKRKALSPASLHNVDEDRSNLKEISRGINAINEKLATMQISIDSNDSFLQNLAPKIYKHENQIDTINSQINSLQQMKMSDRVEISGKWKEFIDKKKSPFKLQIIDLFSKMEIDIESSEIANTFIKQIKEKNLVKKEILVVIFMHEEIKKRVMAKKLKSRNEVAKDIFLNEALTPLNRHILYEARQNKRAGKIHSTGTYNGRVFIRKIDKTPKIFINSLCELEELAKLCERDFREKLNEKNPQ